MQSPENKFLLSEYATEVLKTFLFLNHSVMRGEEHLIGNSSEWYHFAQKVGESLNRLVKIVILFFLELKTGSPGNKVTQQ